MMQAMLNIDHITLSSKKSVTVLYNTGSAPQVHQHVIDGDDPEYLLLAPAIDRFCQTQKQRVLIKQAQAQLTAQEQEQEEKTDVNS